MIKIKEIINIIPYFFIEIKNDLKRMGRVTKKCIEDNLLPIIVIAMIVILIFGGTILVCAITTYEKSIAPLWVVILNWIWTINLALIMLILIGLILSKPMEYIHYKWKRGKCELQYKPPSKEWDN